MQLYKYIAINHGTDEEHDIQFMRDNDIDALEYAKSQDMALIGEDGEAYVLKQNNATSTFGCGHDGCILCNGWLYINQPVNKHGVIA